MASILVIDDEAQVRAFVRLVSEGEGHEVREAADGLEGVKAHRHRPADVILCDLFMPGQEGLETIRQLSAELPGVKVAAMSGGTRQVSGQTFLQVARTFGAADVLEKPLDRKTLISALRAAFQA